MTSATGHDSAGPDFDFDAAVEVRIFEDLTYTDVAPVLDALADTSIFNVRASRDGWSGPAAGGPEVGLLLVAAASVAGGAFVAQFCSELAKDAYKGVRVAILAVVRRLRDRDANQRRAVVGLAIQVGEVSICIGPLLEAPSSEDDWTDEWLILRLRRAQELVDDHSGRPRDRGLDAGPDKWCEFWIK